MNAINHEHRKRLIRRIAQRKLCLDALERRLANPGPITPNVVNTMTGIIATLKQTNMWPTVRQMKFAQRHGIFLCHCGQVAVRVVSMAGYCKRHPEEAFARRERATNRMDRQQTAAAGDFTSDMPVLLHITKLKAPRSRLTL